MNITEIITISSTLALLSGCPVPHDLGAGETETSSGSGSGTGGTAGVGTQTDSTSLTASSTTASTTDGTGDESTSGSEGSGTETGPGPLELCEPSASQARWTTPSYSLFEQLEVENGLFVGVGTCDLTVEDLEPSKFGNNASVDLACTMDGTRDEDGFVQEAIDLQIEFNFTEDSSMFFANIPDSASVRIVLEGSVIWGGDAWLVIEQPNGVGDPVPVLIASSGSAPEPEPADYAAYHRGAWSGGPTFTEAVATCGPSEGKCGEYPLALAASWDGEEVVVHAEEMASFTSPLEETTFDVFPRRLYRVGEVQCGDFPSVMFQYIALARQP